MGCGQAKYWAGAVRAPICTNWDHCSGWLLHRDTHEAQAAWGLCATASVKPALQGQQPCYHDQVTAVPSCCRAGGAQTAAQATALIKLMMSHQSSRTQRGPGNQLSLLGSPSPPPHDRQFPALFQATSQSPDSKHRSDLNIYGLHLQHGSAPCSTPVPHAPGRRCCSGRCPRSPWRPRTAQRPERRGCPQFSFGIGCPLLSFRIGQMGDGSETRSHRALLRVGIKIRRPCACFRMQRKPGLERSRVAAGNAAQPKKSRCSAPHGAQQERCW